MNDYRTAILNTVTVLLVLVYVVLMAFCFTDSCASHLHDAEMTLIDAGPEGEDGSCLEP